MRISTSGNTLKPGVTQDYMQPWGEQNLHLSFAGLQYRIEGLRPEQCQPIIDRFQLDVGDQTPPRTRITIRAGHLPFEETDVSRYADPVCGYSPIIEPVEHGLWVEGLDFRGSITLEPEIRGTLFTNTPDKLGQPMVFENYLRIITAFAALRAGGVLLHSSGIVRDGRAWLFLGPSGAGKTTIARMALATGADILSDDGNLVLPDGQGGFEAGPVPFAGELGQVPCRDRHPHTVAGIFWLRQAAEVNLRPMGDALAYSRIMVCSPTVNVSQPQSDLLDQVLRKLLASIPVFQLDFARDDDFDTVYSHIRAALAAA